MEAASRALTILRQIDNWAGVARAYRAMSSVEERLGNDGPAAALRSIADSYDGLAAEERR
jgi:hypothetical protein